MNALTRWRNAIQEITNTKMKQLYLIEYESPHWCGGDLNVVVWATDGHAACNIAEYHMEDTQRELFSSELDDEPELSEDCAYSVSSIELFDEAHDQWKFFMDPTQESFYPILGKQF